MRPGELLPRRRTEISLEDTERQARQRLYPESSPAEVTVVADKPPLSEESIARLAKASGLNRRFFQPGPAMRRLTQLEASIIERNGDGPIEAGESYAAVLLEAAKSAIDVAISVGKSREARVTVGFDFAGGGDIREEAIRYTQAVLMTSELFTVRRTAMETVGTVDLLIYW